MKFEVDWDYGDSTGDSTDGTVDVENVALDHTPQENEIEVGTSVLFRQGAYDAGATRRRGGKIWHQGVIEEVLYGTGGKKV